MSIIGAAIVGYFFGVSKDRLTAIRNKQIEVGSDLVNKMLDIGEMELSVGESERLAIRVVSGDQRTQDLDSEEVEHLQELIRWRRDIEREERRANMWISWRYGGSREELQTANDALPCLGRWWSARSI